MRVNQKNIIESYIGDKKEGRLINLSKEQLIVSDFAWLTTLIKKSSFLEEIILPPLHRDQAEEILRLLDDATKTNSTLIKMKINFVGAPISDQNQLKIAQIQSRLQRNSERIFAIHGGGNIGLGLLADIVSKSEFKYNIIATSNNQFFNNLINLNKELGLQHSADNSYTQIQNVRMVTRETEDVIALYKKASIAAICLTPNVFMQTAESVARGLLARYEVDKAGLKILILMNQPNCEKFVQANVKEALQKITKDTKLTEEILSSVQFIPTVIDRIVMQKKERSVYEQIVEQLINKGFKISKEFPTLETPKIMSMVKSHKITFNLFNAEKNFSMYLPDKVPEVKRFPQIKAVNDLAQIELLKNKFINGPHAILAWGGAMFGCKTIAEAIKHPILYSYIKTMMKYEIAPVLNAEYQALPLEELNSMKKNFLDRCTASKTDSITRVGRDPLRKLESGGRIRGTIELNQKNKLKIDTEALEQGIALGILYATKQIDPTNPECEAIANVFKKSNGSYVDVLCHKYSVSGCTYIGFDRVKDKLIVDRIVKRISHFDRFYENKQKMFNQPTIENPSPFILRKKSTGSNQTFFGKENRLFLDKNCINENTVDRKVYARLS